MKNNNENCPQCDNPRPNEIYKHLPGYVKLVCDLDKLLKENVVGGDKFVKSDNPVITNLILFKNEVTQTGNINNPIQTGTSAGILTTLGLTTASGASVSFVINNSNILPNSSLNITLEYNGTGTIIGNVVSKSVGSFVYKITNISGTSALNAPLKIHYTIF